MGDGKAFGNHPTDSSQLDQRRRASGSGKARDAGSQAEEFPHEEPEDAQIGTRQRAQASKEGRVREPIKKPSRERPRTRMEERASERSPKGDLRGTQEEGRKERRKGHRDRGEPQRKAEELEQRRRKTKASASESPTGERRKRQKRKRKGQEMEESPKRKVEARSPEPDDVYQRGAKKARSEIKLDVELAKDFLNWMSKNPTGGLSSAQVIKHLVLQLEKLGGPFKEYMMWSLQPPVQRREGDRELFPLPLWLDSRVALRTVLDEESVRDQPGDWRNRGETKSKAAKTLRGDGLRAWRGLLVIALNYLYGERPGPDPPVMGSQATAPQEKALERLWSLAKEFIDEKDKGGVPRTSQEDWEQEVKSLKVSYSGEVMEKAMPLTLEQVLPGLPSEKHGASINVLDVLPEEFQEVLRHPEELVDPNPEGEVPRPKVHCTDEEWPLIVKAMMDRKLVAPVEHYPRIGRHRMVNGAFGVVKPDKFTASGKKVLRLIMDLRSTNHFMKQIPGDTASLTGAATFQRMVVEESDQLLVSGEDRTAAFYLFELPPAWAEFMVLEKPVRRGDVGLQGNPEEEVLVGLRVLPMGWSSAVGIMQAAHRTIALRSPLQGGAGLPDFSEISKLAQFPDLDEEPAWHIYLDDTTIIEKIDGMLVDKLKDELPEEQVRLRKAYSWLGIPTNKGRKTGSPDKW